MDNEWKQDQEYPDVEMQSIAENTLNTTKWQNSINISAQRWVWGIQL